MGRKACKGIRYMCRWLYCETYMNSVLLMAQANNSLNSSESEAEQRKHIHLSAHTF